MIPVQALRAIAALRSAELSDVQIEDRFLELVELAAADLPMATTESVVVHTLVARVRQLVDLRRQRQLELDRHLALLFARVEALEGARVEVRAAVLDHPALRI